MFHPTKRSELANFAGKFTDQHLEFVPEGKIALVGVDDNQPDDSTSLHTHCNICQLAIIIDTRDITELGQDKIWPICPNCYFKIS